MRRKDREVSAEQAWEIVERCSYGVLAMTKPDGTPYAVPVNFAREGNCLYIHCAQAGEKTDCLNHQPQVCVTCVEGGAWVDQPALTTRYASAVMLGRVEELTDEADKVKALRLLCMRLAPEHPRSHGDFSECRGKRRSGASPWNRSPERRIREGWNEKNGAMSNARGTVAFIEKSVFLPGPFASAESPEDREAHPKGDGKSVFDSTL